MKTLQKLLIKVTLLVGFLVPPLLITAPAYATFVDPNGSGTSSTTSSPAGSSTNGGNATNSDCNDSSDQGIQNCVQNNQIVKDLNLVVDFLSVGVGIFIIIMIIIGGIQYETAGGNEQAVSAAKQRITNAILALVVFLLAFGFLQWIIPGGL